MNNNNNSSQELFDDSSSFDYREWALKILHYWYFIVIGLLVAFCLAYLKNRSWKPQYRVEAQVILGNSSPPPSYAFMQGFASDGFSSNNDQLIMFGRYELLQRAISKLPFSIEYFTQGRFKTNYYYKDNLSPIEIQTLFVSPAAYERRFIFEETEEGGFLIRLGDENEKDLFVMEGEYGVPFENSYFFGTILKKYETNRIEQLFFSFRSLSSLEEEFASRLSFSMLENTSVAVVSLTGERIDRDRDFINKLSEEFIDDNLNRKNTEANRTIDFIDTQLSFISDSLAVSSNVIRDFRRENNIIDVNSYTAGLLERSADFEAKKVELDLKEAYFRYLESYLQKSSLKEELLAPSSLGISDPSLLNLVAQLNEVLLKRTEVGPKNPYYEKYTLQIDNFKKTLYEVLKNVNKIYEMDRENLERQYGKVLKEIKSLPEKESKIVDIERRHRVNDNYYTYLLQKRSEAQIRKASNTSDNTILQEARVVSFVNGTVKQKTYLQFLFYGFLIPLVLIIIKELFNNTVNSVSELEKTFKLSVLSVIPYQKMEKSVLTIKNVTSSFTESFRSLRMRVEFLVQKKERITILCTSSESGDGKTYFSINLAGVYALSGKRTLLIDMDLRKPSVTNNLGIADSPGVSNVLIGDYQVESVLLRDEKRKFDVLPAGTIPPNPGELISSERMRELIAELKEKYEFIIIDTSPVGLVSDAYPLTKEADVTFFVVQAGKTNKTFLKEVIVGMKRDKVSNIYAILNGIKERRTGKGYGKYYRLKNSKYYYSSQYFKETPS